MYVVLHKYVRWICINTELTAGSRTFPKASNLVWISLSAHMVTIVIDTRNYKKFTASQLTVLRITHSNTSTRIDSLYLCMFIVELNCNFTVLINVFCKKIFNTKTKPESTHSHTYLTPALHFCYLASFSFLFIFLCRKLNCTSFHFLT